MLRGKVGTSFPNIEYEESARLQRHWSGLGSVRALNLYECVCVILLRVRVCVYVCVCVCVCAPAGTALVKKGECACRCYVKRRGVQAWCGLSDLLSWECMGCCTVLQFL